MDASLGWDHFDSIFDKNATNTCILLENHKNAAVYSWKILNGQEFIALFLSSPSANVKLHDEHEEQVV